MVIIYFTPIAAVVCLIVSIVSNKCMLRKWNMTELQLSVKKPLTGNKCWQLMWSEALELSLYRLAWCMVTLECKMHVCKKIVFVLKCRNLLSWVKYKGLWETPRKHNKHYVHRINYFSRMYKFAMMANIHPAWHMQ